VIPKDFVAAVAAGADMIEIGNFVSLYSQGLTMSSKDVIAMTKEVRTLLPLTPLSVTIPHSLPLIDQISLAKELERQGADVLQTEEGVPPPLREGLSARIRGVPPHHKGGVRLEEAIELAAPSITAAHALSREVSIPVMCASGSLSQVAVPLVLAANADADADANGCCCFLILILILSSFIKSFALLPCSFSSLFTVNSFLLL
jgi:hypothetical protein